MREEASNWWEQAQKDFESIAAFLSQQAAEKALKSLFICKLKDSPGKTHSLLRLGKDVGIPSDYYHRF